MLSVCLISICEGWLVMCKYSEAEHPRKSTPSTACPCALSTLASGGVTPLRSRKSRGAGGRSSLLPPSAFIRAKEPARLLRAVDVRRGRSSLDSGFPADEPDH